MLDIELLRSLAVQMMSGTEVRIAGRKVPVRRTSRKRLKTVTFQMNGRMYEAIEQNAEKPSRWGQLARTGHQVVQIKDVKTNKFVAVIVDGDVKEYGSRARKKRA